MLILRRRINESITFDGPGRIVICGITRDEVKLGFVAEKTTRIVRDNAKAQAIKEDK